VVAVTATGGAGGISITVAAETARVSKSTRHDTTSHLPAVITLS
jgi:hypothetical protein